MSQEKQKAATREKKKDTTTKIKKNDKNKQGVCNKNKYIEKLQRKSKRRKNQSIIKTTLVIHLSSHNHHPDQENQSDNPESKCRIPLRTNGVLFKPSQGIDGDAADVVVVDVAVTVGGYIALYSLKISLLQDIGGEKVKRRKGR
jgi:hypothetical protein